VTLRLTGGGVLPYSGDCPDAAHWSARWRDESLDRLLQVAAASELTRFLERYVRPSTRLLEGGCGLGQYVRYFAERGVEAVGVDYSSQAVEFHRARFPDSTVLVADLECLPFAEASFEACLSLGVIEHYEDGGLAILAEARRVLTDDGLLLLSVPYLNRVRRILRRRIERREARKAEQGATFYQYAFDEASLDDLLRSVGFAVVDRGYYDPGRGLRELRSLALSPPPELPTARRRALPRPHRPLKRAVLYARPMLRTLAHMQVVAATKV
jgi:SAM-dependent methyltransferase